MEYLNTHSDRYLENRQCLAELSIEGGLRTVDIDLDMDLGGTKIEGATRRNSEVLP